MPHASLIEWDGRLLGKTVAIAIGADQRTASGSSPMAALVALSGSEMFRVRPEQLGRFLRIHAKAQIICFDAAQVHWQLHAELQRQQDGAGQKGLWDILRRNRLCDVQLLDQRWKLVATLGFPKLRQLDELVEEYCPGDESMEKPESLTATTRERDQDSGIAAAGQTAIDVLAVYSAILPNVEDRLRELGIPSELASEYGPLGHGIDVQGAVALGSPRRPALSVNATAAEEVVKKAEEVYRRSSATIYKDVEARRPFTWHEDQVRCDVGGYPKIDNGRLQSWLWTIAEEVRDVHDFRFVPPFDSQERLSIVPRHWGILARSHPLLRAWADLIASAEVILWLKSLDWEKPSKCEFVPTMWLSQPDLGVLRRFSPSLFRPRSGHVFLVCRLKYLELRCLARQILRHRPADARIATMLWDNQDPVTQTAMEMREHSAADDSEHGRQFRQRTPQDDDWWKRTARVLLAAVPQGLADTQIRTMLDEEMENKAPGEADVSLLRALFIQHLGPRGLVATALGAQQLP